MLKKIFAVGALLTLCLAAFGCAANAMGVEIDKETQAITLTADQTTNAVLTMDFVVDDGEDFAFAFNVEGGEFRVKLAKPVNDETVTFYENSVVNEDTTYTGKIEPGKYTLTVLALDSMGKFKIEAFDPEKKSAQDVVDELVKSVETTTAQAAK